MTQEQELAIQEFRRQAEEQPELHKLLWRRQLSQQSTYKAEIHELYAEIFVSAHVQARADKSKSKFGV